MPIVERSYFQDGYIADGYYETTFEFQGISLPPNRQSEGFAYILHATLRGETISDEYLSYNHPAAIVDGQFYDPVITSIDTLEMSIIDGSGAIGTRMATRLGNILIGREGNRNMPLTQKQWADQAFTLRRGPRNGPASLEGQNFILIYRGRFRDIRWDEEMIELEISDSTSILDQVPSFDIYDGSSPPEGQFAPDLINKKNPIVYGHVRNVRPNLLDFTTQLYHVTTALAPPDSWAIPSAYDNMSQYTPNGNFPSGGDFASRPVSPGTFITQSSEGFLRLGSVPTGKLSVEVIGKSTSGNRDRDKEIPRIILSMLQDMAPLLPIDSFYYNEMVAERGWPGGFFLPSDSEDTIADVLNLLCTSTGAIWAMTANDIFRIMVWKFRPPYRTITDADVLSRQREIPLPPVWKTEVRYLKNYNVHGANEVQNPLMAPTLRSFALQEWRTVEKSNETVKEHRSDARTLLLETALELGAQADLLALIHKALHEVRRDIVIVTTKDQNFVDELGLTVRLTSDILGIDKDMIVAKVNEQITQRQTALTLWG